MVWESNQNVFLIQIDASGFAEFEKAQFEISRLYCTLFFPFKWCILIFKCKFLWHRLNNFHVSIFRKWQKFSQLSISRSCGDYFLKVQITRSANLFELLWLEKAIKMYFRFRKTLRVSHNSRYPSSRYRESTFHISVNRKLTYDQFLTVKCDKIV